jgi:MFS family permease
MASRRSADSDLQTQARNEKAALLREPQFQSLLSARFLNFLGNSFAPVAVPFAVLSIQGSVADVGIVLAVSTACGTLLLLIAGVIADNVPRRLLLIVGNLAEGLVMLATAVLLQTGRCELWQLIVLQALFGAVSVLTFPAFTGVVPQVVKARHLHAANGLLTATESGAQVLGPALAGVLIAVGDPALALGADAVVFFVAAAFVLVRLRPPATARTGERMSFARDLADGWKEMTSRRWYWITLLGHATCNFSIAVFFVLGPVIVAKELGGAVTWGGIGAAGAFGGLLGGLAFMRLRFSRPLVIGNAAPLLFAPCLLLLMVPGPVWGLDAAAAAGMFGVSILNGAWNSAVQQLIPNEVLSRLASFDWLISFTTMPLGFALAGQFDKSLGTPTLLWIASAALCVPCLLTLLTPGIRAIRSDRQGIVAMDAGWTPGLSDEVTLASQDG